MKILDIPALLQDFLLRESFCVENFFNKNLINIVDIVVDINYYIINKRYKGGKEDEKKFNERSS